MPRRITRWKLNDPEMLNVDPLFRVALAVIAQAVTDLDTHDPDQCAGAWEWLASTGANWVEILLEEDAYWVAGWLEQRQWAIV